MPRRIPHETLAPRTRDSRKERRMVRFMDVHSGFAGVTKEQLSEAHDRDLAIEVS